MPYIPGKGMNSRKVKVVIMMKVSSSVAAGRKPSSCGPLVLMAVLLIIGPVPLHVSGEPVAALAGRLVRGSSFWRLGHVPPTGLFCDFEGGLRAEGAKGEERGAESDDAGCSWKWSGGFRVASGKLVNDTLHSPKGANGNLSGPVEDAHRSPDGHFLLLQLSQTSRSVGLSRPIHMRDFPRVWSPQFEMTGEHCKLEMMINMANMADGSYKVVIEALNTSWIVTEKSGNDRATWERHNCTLGKINQEFHVMLEVITGGKGPAHFAIDNIKLNRCFPEIPVDNGCTSVSQYRCSDGLCLDRSRVCDIVVDCRYAEDETISDCAKMPPYSRCTFEDGWCGWSNVEDKKLKWTIQSGPTMKDHSGPTGPTADHTFGNATGYYAFVSMSSAAPLSSEATLESVTFYSPPPYVRNASSPYHKSCQIRFYYHQFGPHSGSLGLFLVELNTPHGEKKTTQLWWSFGDQGDSWHRGTVPLVNVSSRYYFQFEARKGLSVLGDVGLDDVSISPECFGIGVPQSEIKDWYPGQDVPKGTPVTPTPNPAFANATMLEIGTCGVKGREGPRPEDCTAETIGTAPVVVLTEPSFLAGVQKWVVPESGVYTIIAQGASGGKGSDGVGSSLGSTVRGVLELRSGEPLYFLVGQEGVNACTKNFAGGLGYRRDPLSMGVACNAAIKTSFSTRPKNPINDIKQMTFIGGGGGGGGGTFVFKWAKKKRVPLIVAGGGGGLAHGFISPPETSVTLSGRHGRGFNKSLAPVNGRSFGIHPAGAGGGWTDAVGWNLTWTEFKGSSLLRGGMGGKACVVSSNGYFGFGGFGGGGGGCESGGGGGGYQGGDANSEKGSSGGGGWSYVGEGVRMKKAWPGGDGEPWERHGPGRVFIIPALPRGACGCDYLCVALDVYRSKTQCICPSGWTLGNDSTSCVPYEVPSTSPMLPYPYSISIGVAGCLVAFLLASMCMFMYNRYQKKKNHSLRRKMLSGADLQLNRLRATSGGMMTEYNPNYEFGGGTYTIQDLKDIPRDNLRLVKALGQGAFGEVYQGLFRNRAGDAVEMPVAVKTLPERSSGQAEMDFLMEALIMSKFNHHNIVHFIGVCFDKHPRFIVLELLAGGDLKTFLRESRPKPDRPSPLTMKDLLNCSLDVAKGCKYMEENHFIHRDIAARNCLLTTKGPGRVVKIADFGMARDIYRADYYRKGGKAMLPVKWMPPEAFLDGIFTSKTDVWSFGVLLWEVMSLGYMPYTGRSNQEVMQLVTSGGRLEPPAYCPSPVYGIMTQCWHPRPDHRPSFSTLLERLGYCMQDPDVMSAPLPVFTRPPSAERDATIMRPSALDSSTLLRVHRPENPPHPPAATSEDELLPPPPTPPPPLNDDYLVPSPRPTTPSSWGETSFVDSGMVPLPPEPAASSSSTGHLNNSNHHSEHHQNHSRHHNHRRTQDASSSPGLPESRSTQPLLDDNSPGESPRRLPKELTNSVNSVSHKCGGGVAPSPASETPTRTSDISCSGGEGGADSRSSSQCDPRQAVGSLISLEEGEEAVVPPPPASLPPAVKISPTVRHKSALRATLSLDPSALDRRGTILDSVDNVIKPPAQYANVTPTRTPASKREKLSQGISGELNQSPRNGSPSRASPAFTVQTTASTRHLLSDTEISC